jgi:hypothetical protein
MVFKPNSQRQRTRTPTPPMLEEENKETRKRIRPKAHLENKHDKQSNEKEEIYELQKSNKETMKGMTSTTNEDETMIRTGIPSKGEATKEIGLVTTMAVNRQSESNQIYVSNGANNNNNENGQNTENYTDKNKTNIKNNNNNSSKNNCYYLDFSLIPWIHTYGTYEV